jgi:ketosteroid isomerase-like protein
MRSNTDLIRSLYEAFGRGDIPYVLAQLADDVEWDAVWTLNSKRTNMTWLHGL